MGWERERRREAEEGGQRRGGRGVKRERGEIWNKLRGKYPGMRVGGEEEKKGGAERKRSRRSDSRAKYL